MPRGIRKGLQDLTGKEHQIATAYEISGPGGRVSRVRIPDRTRLRGIRTGLQNLTGSDRQIQDAYKVSGRGCRTSWVRNIRSYMRTTYQGGAA